MNLGGWPILAFFWVGRAFRIYHQKSAGGPSKRGLAGGPPFPSHRVPHPSRHRREGGPGFPVTTHPVRKRRGPGWGTHTFPLPRGWPVQAWFAWVGISVARDERPHPSQREWKRAGLSTASLRSVARDDRMGHPRDPSPRRNRRSLHSLRPVGMANSSCQLSVPSCQLWSRQV